MRLKCCRWIVLFSILLFVSWPAICGDAVSSQKIQKGNGINDGSIHAIGNGKMLVYENGPEIIKMYPAPYSTPGILQLNLIAGDSLETNSSREPATAIWTHRVIQRGNPVGTMIDFVDSELPCMIRHFKLSGKLSFQLNLMENAAVVSNVQSESKQEGSLLLVVPAGTVFYQKYTYPKPLYHQIAWNGNVTVASIQGKKGAYLLTINPGESDLYFSGGPEYPQVITCAEEVHKMGYLKVLERTRNWWRTFTAERKDFEHQIPLNLPLREKLLHIIDDVSVMIKTQQSEQGSVMAGYPYPLGYVRDQYGVSRGLLALGYYKEAKHILEFYRNIWQKYGEIHNAQGIGVEGVFHIHENDEVETPGYLIIQAFDLLEKTGDEQYMEVLFPMLQWCLEVQKKNLVGGMLPFNGDETYVAGGIFPRSALNEGSAEATMLFVEGGEKLIKWIQEHKKWSSAKLEKERMIIEQTRKLFRENFWKVGQLVTNNPERLKMMSLPRFRHGVCERLGPDCIVFNPKGANGIDWTERDENNRYQCPACRMSGPLPKVEPSVYHLISVSLTPLYMHSNLLNAKELKPTVEKVYSRFEKTGILSSIYDSTGIQKSQRTVGYDYGLLLYSMLQTGMQHTEMIFKKTIAVADSAGVWSEYYNDHLPEGTRYRPWESAINIEALLKFANQYHK